MPKAGRTWTPEQRAKILAAKEKRKASVDVTAPEAPVTPRPRLQQYAPRPERPSGARWQMKAGNERWTDGSDHWASGDMPNELQISPDLIPEGISLQWVTDSVYGDSQTFSQRRAGFEKSGWVPVHPEDFDGVFEGMFAPKGAKGEINKGGLVLMAKPTEMVKKSEIREKRKAREQIQIKEQAIYGGEINAMGADHPSAKQFNHVRKSVERITIPTDD